VEVSDVIRRMAHVALRVPDLDASVAWATTVMGMRETVRANGASYLTRGACHHSLQYIADSRSALHHISMQAHDSAALELLKGCLQDEGIALMGNRASTTTRGEIESVAIQGQLGDVLQKNGARFMWGPGRHGAAGRLARAEPMGRRAPHGCGLPRRRLLNRGHARCAGRRVRRTRA
jgi:catechol 2,3-dioxygenase-like lactoylglutathione lyase family enzyme